MESPALLPPQDVSGPFTPSADWCAQAKASFDATPPKPGVHVETKRSMNRGWSGYQHKAGDTVMSDLKPEIGPERMTQLLTLLKSGPDEQAFADLFRFYAPRLKSYMRKLGAAEDMAEELAQEAMAMVWRKAHLFDSAKAGAGTWIFSIARNLRIDAFRRQKRPEVELDDPTFMPDDQASPEAELDQGQQARAVRAALATLPKEQAKIVHLSFFEDKPHAEIAEQLGIPLGTVKSRMRLAFQRFRKALGEPEL
nr:sigma-70 family RNA polymerase sigma factor [uncultured Dongia sp.]